MSQSNYSCSKIRNKLLPYRAYSRRPCRWFWNYNILLISFRKELITRRLVWVHVVESEKDFVSLQLIMRFLWILLLLTMVDGERIVESDNKYVISYTFLSLILLQWCSRGDLYWWAFSSGEAMLSFGYYKRPRQWINQFKSLICLNAKIYDPLYHGWVLAETELVKL